MIYSKKAICVALACCCLSGTAFAQHVSLTMNNVTVKQAMDALKKQSGYSFVFSSEDVDTKKKVSVDADDQKVEEVVRQILDGQSVTYEIKGKNIVVRSIAQTSSSQQKKTITGTIVDPSGMPVIGANVMVKGTTNGTITDMDGKFSLEVASGATLMVSYIGFANQEIKVSNQTNLSIALKEDAEALDELVVVGYGTQKKSDLTGSVSSVKSEVIDKQVVTSVDQALQGRVSGMQITTASGAPGSSMTIRIRGGNSINGGNEPLYVIDGIIGGGDLSMINPADIQSIEVLKDASSTAIYGSRGANGVVLITTKMGRGQEGIKLDYHGYFGLQKSVKFLDMLDGQEYAQWRNEYEAYFGRNPLFDVKNVPNTDWQREMYKTAPITEHNISLSKGYKDGNYFLSLNYLNQDGILKKSGFDRYQIRFNLEQNIGKMFKFGSTMSMVYTDKDNPVISTSGMGTIPVMSIYNEDGKYTSILPISGTHTDTPAAQEAYKQSNTTNLRGMGNIYAQLTPLKGLTIRSSFGFDLNRSKQNDYISVNMPTRVNNKSGGYAYVRSDVPMSIQNENTVNYGFDIKDHHWIY